VKIRILKTPVKHARFLAGCFFAVIGFCAIALFAVISVGRMQSALASGSSGYGYDKTVIIDPGHGGIDGGAVGYGGVVEKGINLAISLKLRSLFEASGFQVIMTRNDDRSIYDEGSETVRQKKVTDIHNRSKLLADYPKAVFISIHQNKFQKAVYSGTQVFYSNNNDNGKLLAQFIQTNVKNLIQPDNERGIKPAGKNLYILYHAKSPAVMVECGFLSNPREAALLQNNSYQNKMAFAVFCGTLDYYSGL
jgi:N-acetylmuramoyl-L-alanine amidase